MSEYFIRELHVDDLSQLVELCLQLERPASLAELTERFAELSASPGQVVFVAAQPDGTVLGWLHVQQRPALHTARSAAVHALVVGAAHRRLGCGRALMAQAETWARGRQCRELVLRSALDRKEAHRFYAALGYDLSSTSYKFTRRL